MESKIRWSNSSQLVKFRNNMKSVIRKTEARKCNPCEFYISRVRTIKMFSHTFEYHLNYVYFISSCSICIRESTCRWFFCGYISFSNNVGGEDLCQKLNRQTGVILHERKKPYSPAVVIDLPLVMRGPRLGNPVDACVYKIGNPQLS